MRFSSRPEDQLATFLYDVYACKQVNCGLYAYRLDLAASFRLP